MSPFGIGTLELVAILLSAVLTLAIFFGRFQCRRWSVAILACVTLAAIFTPADIFSLLLMSSVLVAVYYTGTRHYARDAS